MEHPEKRTRREPRKRRIGKRAWLLIALSAALAVAAAFVLLLPTIKEAIPNGLNQKAELTYKTLETGDKTVLATIDVTHDDGEHYTLTYRDGALYLAGDEGEELINESYTDMLVSAATEIAVEDTVTDDVSEVAEHLGDMGLEPPKIAVTIAYTDGKQVELKLGTQAPETSYHYYMWSGDQGVYLCDTGIYEAFEYTARMLLPVEQPAMSASLIDRLTIETKQGGKLRCEFVRDVTTFGTIVEPFVYPMDNEATTTLLNALHNFRLGTKMGAVTAENRAEYGFDDPTAVLDVHQQAGYGSAIDADGVLQTVTTEANDVHLVLGAQDGDYFYFCEYAGECYRVSSFLVATLVAVTPEKYVTRAPANMGGARVSGISIQLASGAVDVRATYTERVLENNELETDSDGNTVYDVAVTANGEEISTDTFDALVTRLAQMTVSGVSDAAATGTARWTMTITTTGGVTRTIAAYPMDAFSDVLTVDGVAKHYVSSEAIVIALAELYPN